MLTQKQKDLLLLIDKKIKTEGVPPSYDEMKDALGLASKKFRSWAKSQQVIRLPRLKTAII